MNFDEVFNAQNTSGIPPEKLAFLKTMASMNSGSSPQELMAAMMAVNNSAQKQGISFTDSERELMLELLVQSLPQTEGAKAKRMIQLLKHMRH